MTGSVFISAPTGWACSNEMFWIIDREIIEREGKKVSKHTNFLKIKALFLHNIEISKGLFVDLVVKLDDSDNIQGFTGVITGQTKETTAIQILTTTERTQEILNKIKEEN
jgi:hypothetical protein